MREDFEEWLRRPRAMFPLTRDAYRRLPIERVRELARLARRDAGLAGNRNARIEAEFAVRELDAAIEELGQ